LPQGHVLPGVDDLSQVVERVIHERPKALRLADEDAV
jgi:hypothetical protein